MLRVLEAKEMGTLRVMVPQIMAEKGMNVSDLAKALGTSWPTANKLASGKMAWALPEWAENFVKLCEIFGIQPGDVLVIMPDDNGDQ
jgi:DNA-binding Xre family transcriptional regulator